MRFLTILFLFLCLQSFSQLKNVATSSISATVMNYENETQKPQEEIVIPFKEFNEKFSKYKEFCATDSSESITYSAIRYKDGIYVKFDTTIYPTLTPTYAGFMHYLNHYTTKNYG